MYHFLRIVRRATSCNAVATTHDRAVLGLAMTAVCMVVACGGDDMVTAPPRDAAARTPGGSRTTPTTTAPTAPTVPTVPTAPPGEGPPTSTTAPFTVVAPGTRWQKESVHPLRWSVPTDLGPLDNTVTLVQSLDAGATWQKVREELLEERYARWTVPADADHGRVGLVFHRTEKGVPITLRRVETLDIAFSPSMKRSYTWEEVTPSAAFGPRDGAGGIVFGGKMWLLGGWNPDRFPLQSANDVWSSTDGATWVEERANTFLDARTFPATDWEGRHFGGYHAFAGKMWIVGGDPNQGYYQTDVWCSTNGRDWTRTDIHTTSPRLNPVSSEVDDDQYRPVEESQFGLRTAQITGVFGGKLVVAGGQRISQYVNPNWPGAIARAFNDVWTSTDGASFSQVATIGPMWSPRGYVSEVVEHAGRLWVIGGGLSEDPASGRKRRVYLNDVWSTSNGAEWQPVVDEPPFSPRIWHNVKAFDGRLWLINGYDGNEPDQGRLGDNRSDVWYSTDGRSWYEASPPASFVARHAGTAWVHGGSLFVGSGNAVDTTWHADVWKLTLAP